MQRKYKLPKVTPIWLLLMLLTSLMGVSAYYSINSLNFCQNIVYQEWQQRRADTDRDTPIEFDTYCPEVRQRAEANLNQWLTFILALMVQFKDQDPPV